MIAQILQEPWWLMAWITWLGLANALSLAFLDHEEARWVLAGIGVFRHPARPPGGVHGIDGRAEHGSIDMPDQDRQGGQPGFVVVNHQNDFQNDPRHVTPLGQEVVEPQHHARCGHE